MSASTPETTRKAELLWASMSNNEKTGVRFGLFPHDKIKAAESEGFDGHVLCVALMDCAQKDGGMRA